MKTGLSVFWDTLSDRLRQADRLVLGKIVLWIAALVSLPILYWTFDRPALRIGIEGGVLVQVAAVLVILAHRWGVWKALSVGIMVACLTWVSEVVGTKTGLLFGAYHYTHLLQPQVLNVPVLIPLAWLMMLPPAWAAAWLLVGPSQRFVWACTSAVTFTVWDLFLDPQMVTWEFWQWDQPGGYFGIPWVNFLGWLLVSFGVTLAASIFFQPSELPASPLMAVYIITWLLQTIGQLFFWGLPGPALVGFLGMGAVLLAVFSRRRPEER